MMRFNRTPVAIAITTTLAKQAFLARTHADQEQCRQLSQAIADGLKVTDKQYSKGLLGRSRKRLNRLRVKF